MKKLFLLFTFYMLYDEHLTAQFEEPSWLFTIDAFNDADISDLEIDQEGNTYVVANYMGTLNLVGNNGRPLGASSHMAGVLIKLDRQGKLIWCRGFESAFDNRINDLALGPDGSVFITGFGDGLMHFWGKKDDYIVGRAREQNESHQPQGIYIAKYTGDGDRAWVNYWSTSWGEGKSISVNSKGEVVWSYYHYSELKNKDEVIDPFKRSPTEQVKVSLAYFLPDGKLIRIQPFQILTFDSNVRSPKLKHDQTDNLFCFGQFKKSILLGKTDSLTNDGYYEGWDSYLAKYSPSNELIWQRQFSGQNIQVLEDIDIDEDGSVYGTGQYSYECILMDAIKSAQKSKFEYKSGNSFFYFHLFEDGETDFIRFEDGKGYNGSFMGVSIDHDVNGKTHIIGTFTDTLNIDGFTLEGMVYPASGFASTWDGVEPELIDELATMHESWLLGRNVRSSNNAYAIGAMYYGKDVSVKINGKYEKLSFVDYGRGTVVFGGAVKNTRPVVSELAELREQKRLKRLEGIEALFSCRSPKLEDVATTWYPTLDSIPSRDSLWINNSPCGLVIDDLEASLFPNPSAGPVTVRLKGMEGTTTQIDVYSEQGQLMYNQRILVPSNDYNVDFDMTNAPSGTYFVRITHGQFEKALRLVKMRI